MRILLIEDYVDIAKAIRDAVKDRYSIDLAYTAEEGLFQLEVNEYGVIVVDISLPDIDGITLCRKIRTMGITTPILVLTASSRIEDKVNALDAGADDFISKPFNFPELFARFRALSRRNVMTISSNKINVGELELDTSTGAAFHKGTKLSLRRKEFLLLEYFMRNAGKIVTRNMLLEHVWDNNSDPLTNTIDVHIKFLRDKVDKPFETHLIRTVHGMGYKLEAEVA